MKVKVKGSEGVRAEVKVRVKGKVRVK